jgi:hypothetical protein
MSYCGSLASDRDALLFFLAHKVVELRDVNVRQNRNLASQGVPMAAIARYLEDFGVAG